MDRGWIKLHRKLLDSPIFGHEGLLKLWILCLLKANHKEQEIMLPGLLDPIKLTPGQFVTGRDSLHRDYHLADAKPKRYSRKLKPVATSLYRWLDSLSKVQNLHIKKYSKYSIITITNWDIYQETAHELHISCTSSAHRQECKEEITPEVFLSLRERYSNQELIEQCFDAIRSTRKTGKVADSVLVAQLKKWDRYPVEQVEEGIMAYLDKDYAAQGKREEYLYGIIRNQPIGPTEQKQQKTWRDDLPDL